LDKTKVHPGIQCLVVRVWFCPLNGSNAGAEDACIRGTIQQSQQLTQCSDNLAGVTLEVTWGVHLSGLECLGPHPPAQSRLPADAIVFIMSGYYFTASDRPVLSKHLYIRAPVAGHNKGPGGGGVTGKGGRGPPLVNLATKSYDTGLVLRLHRMQSSLHDLETKNSVIKSDIRNKGVMEEGEVRERVKVSQPAEKAPLLLRQKDLFNPKKSKTCRSRLEETHLQLQLESLHIRMDLLKREVAARKAKVEADRAQAKRVSDSNTIATKLLCNQKSVICQDQLAFQAWRCGEFEAGAKHSYVRLAALRDIKLNLVRGLSELYPIHVTESGSTIRWVSLPDAGEALRQHAVKDEKDASVAVSWLAHLVHLVGSQLSLPLRYPIRLMGSTSTILDYTKDPPDEYPLHMQGNRNSSGDRFEMAVFLLSRNISQLRWHFQRHTKDLKPLLRNVSELLELGKSNEEIDRIFMLLPSQPASSHVIPPPPRPLFQHNGGNPAQVRKSSRSGGSGGGHHHANGRAIQADEVGIEATEGKLSELMSYTKSEASGNNLTGGDAKGVTSPTKTHVKRSI